MQSTFQQKACGLDFCFLLLYHFCRKTSGRICAVKTEINAKKLSTKQLVLMGISFIYWLATFYMERFVFTPGAAQSRLFTYVVIKILTLLSIYALLSFFVNAFSGWKKHSPESEVLKYTIVPFVLITAVWKVCNAWPLSYGDQLNIIEAAYNYSNMGGFFNYLTTYVFMIGMNLFPSGAFSVIFKMFLVSLGAGYCVYRLRKIRRNWLPFLIYGPFLVPPGLYLSYNVHRIPVYAVLYLVFSCVLLCDWLEGKQLGKGKFVLLCFVIAMLTQWRSEGICLYVFGPLLLYFCYKPKLTKKSAVLALVFMLLVQAVVSVPQKLEESGSTGDRAMPFFEYVITNMERNGLDKEKNTEDLALVDKYISVDGIHELNEQYGDYCYADNAIRFMSDAINEGASEQERADFRSAVIRIMMKNPLVYIKSQLGAWHSISTSVAAERKLDIIANVFTDLYSPTIIMLAFWLWALVKKKWCYWCVTSCHLGHMVITTALLPAAYFKYYYQQYLYAVLIVVFVLQLYLQYRDRKTI